MVIVEYKANALTGFAQWVERKLPLAPSPDS